MEASKPTKNKFVTLLIMLGMLFLLSLFKENPTPKSSETTKLKAPKMELNQVSGGEELIKSSQRAFMELE